MASNAFFCGTMMSHTEALHKVYRIHSNGCCCSCPLCYIPSEHHYLHVKALVREGAKAQHVSRTVTHPRLRGWARASMIQKVDVAISNISLSHRALSKASEA